MSGAIAARALTPRGFRNCNPGNIRRGDDWDGLADIQTDPAFCVFQTPEYGFRALAKVLLKYRSKHGIRTVGQVISRWAPPAENDTPGYIRFVSISVGVEPDEEIDLSNRHTLFLLAKAIARKENGRRPDGADWFTDAQVLAGVDLALV